MNIKAEFVWTENMPVKEFNRGTFSFTISFYLYIAFAYLDLTVSEKATGDLQRFEIYNFKEGQEGKKRRKIILNSNPR